MKVYVEVVATESEMCSSKKHPHFTHRRDWNFQGVRSSGRPKNLKKCVKLNLNFQRGGKVLEKNPFREGGMDIFWNYTMLKILQRE